MRKRASSSFFNHRVVDINKIMQSRISGATRLRALEGRGKREGGGERRETETRPYVRASSLCVVCERTRGRERERERVRDRIIVRGLQRYLLHIWGGEKGKIIMANWGINCTSLFAVR